MENRTDNIIFSFIGFVLGALSVVCWLSAGGWLLEVLGISLATAQVLLSILQYTTYSLLLAVLLLVYIRSYFSKWRTKCKNRKQENAALITTGGNEHEHKEKV